VLVCLVMLTALKLYICSVQLRAQTTDMKNVSISEFRAHLLQYLTQVQQGEQINVTSKGNLLATLTPPVGQQNAARAKLMKRAETAVLHDVISPTEESWDAMR
jgi:prevent-host-death family protein